MNQYTNSLGATGWASPVEPPDDDEMNNILHSHPDTEIWALALWDGAR